MDKEYTLCGRSESRVLAGFIRTVWAISIVLVLAAGAGAEARTIKILSGTYGQNCGAARGNATKDLAAHCDNKDSCAYRIDKPVIGDPAVGCQKGFLAEWQCSDTEQHAALIAPEAGTGSHLVLSCINPVPGAGR